MIEKEDRNRSSGWQTHPVGLARVHSSASDIVPLPTIRPAHRSRLSGRKDREFESEFGHDVQRLEIYRGFGQPHSFRLAPEPMEEILNPPMDLSEFISAAGQRQNHMV